MYILYTCIDPSIFGRPCAQSKSEMKLFEESELIKKQTGSSLIHKGVYENNDGNGNGE